MTWTENFLENCFCLSTLGTRCECFSDSILEEWARFPPKKATDIFPASCFFPPKKREIYYQIGKFPTLVPPSSASQLCVMYEWDLMIYYCFRGMIWNCCKFSDNQKLARPRSYAIIDFVTCWAPVFWKFATYPSTILFPESKLHVYSFFEHMKHCEISNYSMHHIVTSYVFTRSAWKEKNALETDFCIVRLLVQNLHFVMSLESSNLV